MLLWPAEPVVPEISTRAGATQPAHGFAPVPHRCQATHARPLCSTPQVPGPRAQVLGRRVGVFGNPCTGSERTRITSTECASRFPGDPP